MKRLIICFEGIDGCGKSTQVRLLAEKLRREGHKVEIVKHPGQTEFGQEVRRLILEGVQPRSDLAYRLLFWADLAETAEAYKKNVDFLIFDRHPRFSKFMVRRFNADAGEVMEKIQRVASTEILDRIMEEVFAANTLEEAQFIIRRAVGKSLQ
ncbi:MAG: hypothetical protein AB1523_11265 [Bacillota bacterium]